MLILFLGRTAITPCAAEEVREVKRQITNHKMARTSNPNPSRPPAPAPTPAAIAQFRAHCLECHDGDGRGEIGREMMRTLPDFTDPAWQAARSDQQLRHSIQEGKGKVMPSWKRKLAPAEIERLIVLVRRFSGGRLVVPEEGPATAESHPEPTGVVARANASPGPSSSSRTEAVAGLDAGAIFRRSCQICHGADGRGTSARDRLPSIPDFTSGHWQQGRSRAQLAASILEGKSDRMPSFRGKLGDEQADALAAYVTAFGPPPVDPPKALSQDYHRRLDHLKKEFEELRRAYREISPGP